MTHEIVDAWELKVTDILEVRFGNNAFRFFRITRITPMADLAVLVVGHFYPKYSDASTGRPFPGSPVISFAFYQDEDQLQIVRD